MQLYKINPNTLELETAKRNSLRTYLIAASILLLLGFSSGVKVKTMIERIPIILRPDIEECNLKSIKNEISRKNLRFQKIVYQQAVVESGYLKDERCRQNKNPFCMRLATQRATTATGESLGFAVYGTWQDAVTDYALWQEAYTRDIKTEEEYYYFLDKVYCEPDGSGVSYSSRLKQISWDSDQDGVKAPVSMISQELK